MTSCLRLTRHPSPNFGERRKGARPELVVLHYTGMPSCAEALDRLCDPAAEVSAHYLIAEDGEVLMLVPEDARAWHAGVGGWGGRDDVNSRSIGIEIANTGDAPFPCRQMTALELLLGAIRMRWGIGPELVIAHSDMAPTRKSDPGPRFDWRGLARVGLSVWPVRQEAEPDMAVFLAALRRFGYPDAPPEALLRAFRLRFFPRAEGALSAAEMGAALDLAQRFPVDGRAARA